MARCVKYVITQTSHEAIVTLPYFPVETMERGRMAASNEQKIRNVTRWSVYESQLVLHRGEKEVARFKDWIGVRSQAVES